MNISEQLDLINLSKLSNESKLKLIVLLNKHLIEIKQKLTANSTTTTRHSLNLKSLLKTAKQISQQTKIQEKTAKTAAPIPQEIQIKKSILFTNYEDLNLNFDIKTDDFMIENSNLLKILENNKKLNFNIVDDHEDVFDDMDL